MIRLLLASLSMSLFAVPAFASGIDDAIERAETLRAEGRQPETVDKAQLAQAVQWAERSRELGNPAGSNLLYMIHGNGYGGPVDMPRAVGYLKEAAEQGDPSARTNYAVLAYRGTPEIPRDRELAGKCFLELAKREPPPGRVTVKPSRTPDAIASSAGP